MGSLVFFGKNFKTKNGTSCHKIALSKRKCSPTFQGKKNIWRKFCHIRDLRKVRKRQHQYPEFGYTQGEIEKKNLRKSTLAFKPGGRWGLKLRKPSILMVPEFHPVFLFPLSVDFHCSYVYSYYNSSRTLCIKC